MGKSVCLYFLNNSCNKGSACQFLHEKPQESAQKPKTATLCKYFVQGQCLKGTYCSFSHSIPDSNSAAKPCVYFLKGSCKNGAKCAYAHSATEGSISSERSVDGERPLDDQSAVRSLNIPPSNPPSFFAPGYPVYYPLPYPFLQNYTPPSLPSPVPSDSLLRNPADESAAICQSFLRGKCSIQQCRLRHFLEREEMSVLALMPSGDPTRFCPQYYQAGFCDTTQTQCLFRHCLTEDEIDLVTRPTPTARVNGATSPLPPKLSKLCRYFTQGRCNKGDSCSFSHDTLPKPVESQEQAASTPGPDATEDAATWASCGEGDPWGEYIQPSSSPKTVKSVESPPTPPSRRKSSRAPNTALWKEDDPWADQNHSKSKPEKQRLTKSPLSSDVEGRRSDKVEENGQETERNLWDYSPDAEAWSTPSTQTQSSSSPASSTIAVNECGEEVGAMTRSQAEDEATWTNDWDELIEQPSRIHKPCLAFGQGFCQYSAEECVFLHILPDGRDEEGAEGGQEDESSRPDAEHETINVKAEDGDTEEMHAIPQTIDSSFFAVRIRFGPGGIPEQISTPFESSSLTIANLPSTVSEDEVRDLCDSYGEIQNIALEFAAESVSAIVDYASPAEAAEAASHINNAELLSMRLTARLTTVQPNVMMESNVTHKAARTVKIMWPINTQSAWAYYPTVSEAKAEQKRVNNMVFEGRAVTATFENPKGSNPAYRGVIRIQNLCWDSDKDTVGRLCPTASLISLASKTLYTESPVNPIHQVLRRYGEVDSVVLIQNDKTKKKAVAFARFSSSDAAKQAVAKFDRSMHSFIGNQALSLSLVYSVRYTVPASAFSTIRPAIDRVSEHQKVYFSDPDAQDNVCVVLTTDDSSSLKTLIGKVEQDVHGYTMVDSEGNNLWDDLVETEAGSIHLKQLNEKLKTAFVMPDFRDHALRVFGPEESRRDATKAVLKFLQKVRVRYHVLPLEGSFSTALLQGGWNKLLQERNAKSRFSLDLVDGKLFVRGDDAYLERTKNLVNSCAPCSTATASTSPSKVCTICALPSPDHDQWTISCGHTYCKGCLIIFFLSMISPRISSWQCLAKDPDGTRCSTLFSYGCLNRFLTPEEVQETLELSFLSYIRGHPKEFRFCPTPHCAMVYRPAKSGTILRCLVCLTWICPSCHVELHEGIDCDEYSGRRAE